jgi:hypothetical protein
MKYLAILLLYLAVSSYHIIKLHEYLPEKERVVHHETVDAVLKHYFTDKAYEALKDIPVLDGPAIAGSYVGGANFWGTLASFISFNGLERNIIIHSEALKIWGIRSFLHECVHHLDDMTRDGEGDFINIEEFLEEFHKLETRYVLAQGAGQYHLKMYPYVGDYKIICEQADRFVTNVFGIGEHSELIAYAAQYLKKHKNWPSSYKRVFRKVFK